VAPALNPFKRLGSCDVAAAIAALFSPMVRQAVSQSDRDTPRGKRIYGHHQLESNAAF
jgi:hypothetical protein